VLVDVHAQSVQVHVHVLVLVLVHGPSAFGEDDDIATVGPPATFSRLRRQAVPRPS
jgi:hypothetical protein